MQKLLSRPLSNPPKPSFSYFFSHSVSKTTYDPPFSHISKPSEPPKLKPKTSDPIPNRNPTPPIESSIPFDFRHSYSETDPLTEERMRILGDPLTEEEVGELVEKYRHNDCARQINMDNFVFHLFFNRKGVFLIQKRKLSFSFMNHIKLKNINKKTRGFLFLGSMKLGNNSSSIHITTSWSFMSS